VSPRDPLVEAYLRHSLVARVATLGRTGEPALTPLWFVWHQGRMHLGTARSTLAARNAAVNPAVAVLLDDSGSPRESRVLRLRGRVGVRYDLPSWGVLAQLARKYYLSPGGLRSELAHASRWLLRARYYRQAQPALLEVEPLDAELLPGEHAPSN
jgi:pyridoxamine 5'-phosphate oxidase-like protein